MTTEEEIIVNQLAQGILDWKSGVEWFQGLPVEGRQPVLREIGYIASQAGAKAEDVNEVLRQTGLRDTYTPCVIMRKGQFKAQLAKILVLPPEEQTKVFLLLVGLLSVADARRRETKCAENCNHWWHRNLADPQVVSEIRWGHR
jgi:hypothetical protein